MEPNKFEKHIKEQLQEREIQPSAEAWERLSEQLDEVAPPPNRRNFFRYGVAASIVTIMVVSLLFFNTKSTVNTPDVQVVETKEDDSETKAMPTTDFQLEEADKVTVVENTDAQPPATQQVETVVENIRPEVKHQIASVQKKGSSAPEIEKKIRPNDFKEEMINTKILEIVATVDSLERNNDALTEAEVDDLLRNAQDEILVDKLFDKKGSVDAMALLTEVEDELDQSFRDQIFESLKTGFLKVRTAVADRNK